MAPFYLLLGLLLVTRTAIQSMGDSHTPFAACVIELFMRIAGTAGLASLLAPYGLRYVGICLAHPLAWLGALAILVPMYRKHVRAFPA